jgi:hypothetical protein
MRAIKPNTRRRSVWRTALLAIVAIVIGGAGTVAALVYVNVIDSAKLAFWRNNDAIPKGSIQVPMCARPIPAYTMVTRDYLMNPKTGEWIFLYRLPKEVPKGVITNRSKIFGRVMAREKPAGYVFTEEDFLPEGTRPGVTGGTPEGKRAITLDASKLKGAHDLRGGDHVDLLASIPVDMPGAGHSSAGRSGTSVVATPNATLLPKRSFIRPLVEDGVVVTPERTREVPISSSSLIQGTSTHTMPVQEIVLAVEPEEVALLAEAMDLKYEITCVARSSRPSKRPLPAATSSTGGSSDFLALLKSAFSNTNRMASPANAKSVPTKSRIASRASRGSEGKDHVALDITPGLDPFANIRYLEIMIGSQRQFMLFTGPGNSPVVAMQDDGLAKAGSATVPAGGVE